MRVLIDEADGTAGVHPVRPEHISLDQHFWNAFGNNETEISAAWIVRLCQQFGGWLAFTAEQIEKLYNEKGYRNFFFNGLVDGKNGFVVLGEDGKFRVTHDFICRCLAASPRVPLLVPSVPARAAADTAEGLLRELATHLQHDASLNRERFPGRRVGALSLSHEEGALWRRIVLYLGGEPDMLRDVEIPAIMRELAEGQ